jgi:hypothetical protein
MENIVKIVSATLLFAFSMVCVPVDAASDFTGNLAVEQMLSAWSGRLVRNDLFKSADPAVDQAAIQKFEHQVFDVFIPIQANDDQKRTRTLFYNPVSQQLTVLLAGDFQMKAGAFVEAGVHPSVAAYPVYFLGESKDYGTADVKARSGLVSEINTVQNDRNLIALINFPFDDPRHVPFLKSVSLPAARAQSVLQHAMWHMTVESALAPSQWKFVPEDVSQLGAGPAFTTQYRTESHIATVALKSADLIDASDGEIILSILPKDVDAFERSRALRLHAQAPAASDAIFSTVN